MKSIYAAFAAILLLAAGARAQSSLPSPAFGTLKRFQAQVTTQAGAIYTLTAADCGTRILFTSPASVTVTLPSTLGLGCQVALAQYGSGAVSAVAGSGAVLRSAGATGTVSQYSVVRVSLDQVGNVAAWSVDAGSSGAMPVAYSGPGSAGFLSACSSTFSVTNNILYSQAIGTSPPWFVNGATTTANSSNAPDGTSTASILALPSTASASASLFQAVSLYPGYTYTYDLWIKGAAGGEKVWLTVSRDASGAASSFSTTPVVATTAWQRVSLTWAVGGSGGSPIVQYVSLGTDLRDPAQAGGAPAQSIYVWGAQVVGGSAEMPYVATTSAAATANRTVACPAGVAFRDFSTLAYQGEIIRAGAAGTYSAGGVSGPYVRDWSLLGGTYYGLANCTPAPSGTRSDWFGQCLYTSSDLRSWTARDDVNPVITRTAGAWDDHYLLHGAPSPACSVAAYCYYYSAMDASGASSIGLATSSDMVHWAKYGTAPVIPASAGRPSLPSVIQIGATLFMYASLNDNNGQYTVYFTSPASDGINWTLGGTALNPGIAGVDWEQPTRGYIDSFVWKNSHGFYEMAYTSFNNTEQKIGYAVSADGKQWFKYQATPIITKNSAAYPGSYFFGDIVVVQRNGTFYMLGNYDDGTINSNATLDTMADH